VFLIRNLHSISVMGDLDIAQDMNLLGWSSQKISCFVASINS
jgi:hypothetical protein